MSTRYNTGNPIESTDVRDMSDNAKNFDEFSNSTSDSFTDRLGRSRQTIEGTIRKAGFQPASFDFVTGGTLVPGDRNKAVFNPEPSGDNNWYAWQGAFPKIISPNSTPSTSGGLGDNAWKPRTDQSLRGELAEADGAGLTGFSYAMPYLHGTVGKRLQHIVVVTDEPFNADPTFTTDSTSAFLAAIAHAVAVGASVVLAPAGRYMLTADIIIPPGITLLGDGIDYWDAYRPAPDRLLKSWDKGTHLVFTGTGTKNKTCRNLHNARPTKTVGGVPYPFTDFTNNDSVAGAPATAKPFSVAVTVQRGAQLKNLRVMVSKNGIDGYNDAASLTLGDDWDVGVWVYDSSDAIVDNVQSVGYWRMAGWLVTENDGSYTLKGNPERTKFHKLLGQGRRGIIQRNSPQIDVVSNTTTTVTCKYNSSWTLTAQNQFTIPGSSSKYTFTGYSVAGNAITLTGVTPNLPGSVSSVRAPNQGNNFSGSVFTDCVFFALEHTSGTKSADLGIGEAGAFEIDGYPMRNLKFINTKFQTIFDRLNGLWGDCRDVKLVACEHENGELIAYNSSETGGYTGNLRLISSDIQSSVGVSAFTPRDMFDDYKQFPARNSSGEAVFKNWRDNDVGVQWFGGGYAIRAREWSGDLELSDKSGAVHVRVNTSSGYTDIFGSNVTLKNTSGDAIITAFGSSRNTSFHGNASPSSANSGSVGTVALPWAGGATQTAFTVTSDARSKTEPVGISDELAEAVMAIVLCQYKIKDRVAKKGDEARWHHGAIAQQVLEAFVSRGLDPHEYAFFCFDRWGGSDEVIGEDGSLIHPAIEAGESYSLRYEELLVVIAAALKRKVQMAESRLCAIESRLTLLESK